MFTCDSCHKPSAPGVSPLMVPVQTRPVEYMGMDEELKVLVIKGLGTEIVKEHKVCPTCSGASLHSDVVTATNNQAYLALGLSMQAHGAKCSGKKKYTRNGVKVEEPCPACERNVKAFLEIPDHIMNLILTEPSNHVKPPTLIARAVERLIDRSTHKSKRARADYGAGFALFQAYEQAGGSL